jgi:hypothetical protein
MSGFIKSPVPGIFPKDFVNIILLQKKPVLSYKIEKQVPETRQAYRQMAYLML